MGTGENVLRLNKTSINALVADPVGNRFYPVEGYKGLCIQVTKAGAKSFILRYRFHGAQKMHTLGTYPAMTCDAAEKAHTAKWTLINSGTDPNQANADAKVAAKAAKAAAVTVADLAERFIAEHIGAEVIWEGDSFKLAMILDASGKSIGNKESTAREHIRLIHRNILPTLGKLPLKDVGTPEVESLLFKIRKEHPTQSNRVRAVLSKMFAKAELWGLRPAGSNPSRGQDRAPERKKKRNLSDVELLAVGAALRIAEEATGKPHVKRKEGEPKMESLFALAAVRLALLTGMRKSEIIGDNYRGMPALTWADVDLDAGILTVHHKTEGKTGEKRIVYLCEAAQQLLRALPRQLGNRHVIPGEVAGRSLVNLQLVWDRIRDQVTETSRKEAKEAGLREPKINIQDVTIHDLRRSFASVGARLGYPELWLGGLLGHSASTVTQGYTRVDGGPLREAVEATGGRIAGLLSGEIDPAQEAEGKRQEKTNGIS